MSNNHKLMFLKRHNRFNVINHQGNANQNHGEIAPRPSKNGCYQKA